MRPVYFIFHTGAGPIKFHEGIFEPDWMIAIRVFHKPRRRCATYRHVKVVGTVMAYERKGGAPVQVVFRIVKNLAEPVLLGVMFIYRSIREYSPPKGRQSVQPTAVTHVDGT